MAYTTINDPSAYFQTKLYTGTGSSLALTNDGNSDLQPDWVWIKPRNDTRGHHLFNSVIGVGKSLVSNEANDEESNAQTLTAFGSDGFTVGTSNDVNKASNTHVAWQWKAGTAISSASTGGSGTAKTYSGTVNTTAGFSIISYVGNGTDNHQVPHHLGAIPKMFIMKNRSRDSRGWNVYHHTQTASNGALLNTDDAYGGDGSMLNNVEPTSVFVNLGDSSETNQNDDDHIMYAFAPKQGYSKFGSYVGNGNADGPFIYTGFKPAFLLYKQATDAGKPWYLADNTRDIDNPAEHYVFPNLTDAENASHGNKIDFLANGYKSRSTGTTVNASGKTFIYMAFAENPFVTSTGVPATAR
jgi:hypothetical protein